METICGIDCGQCSLRHARGGCVKTKGKPFHAERVLAACCHKKGYEHCSECESRSCSLKEGIMAEFNALDIKDMESVPSLNPLIEKQVNMEYTLASGQKG